MTSNPVPEGTALCRGVPEGTFPASTFPGLSELVRKVLWSEAHGLFLPAFWGEGVRACLAAVMGQCAGLRKCSDTITDSGWARWKSSRSDPSSCVLADEHVQRLCKSMCLSMVWKVC